MHNRIRKLRLEKGWTLRQLEAKSGVGFGILTRWERDLVTPRVDLAYYVAQALGVSIEYKHLHIHRMRRRWRYVGDGRKSGNLPMEVE